MIADAVDGGQVDHLVGIDAGEYPLLAKAVAAVPDRDADTRFTYALDALLKGLDAGR